MRQVINRIIYDTSKATVIAKGGNDYAQSDHKYEWETLYRTGNGRWFLHGEGGALSSYSKPIQNQGYVGSERIDAMTDEQAMDWLERYNHVDVLQKHFPDMLEEA